MEDETWLRGAGRDDPQRRTSGCCETHLLFGTPEEALEFPLRFLSYAMTYASDEDIEILKKHFSDDEFKADG
ncbi:MAG: hypothetical protein DMG48_01410 [Acidobacteria bacterium]|nr:MAG: hypothetical protein DMG48_01410 [Acidobacteriota bacterium]